MLTQLSALPCAYLIGSISAAILLTRLFKSPDPRTTGSGNPGATNVFRQGKPRLGLLVFVCDALKGALVVLVFRALEAPAWQLAFGGLLCLLGHCYPLFHHFKGGKGVATYFGIISAISPFIGLLAALNWLLIASLTHYASLASMLSVMSAPCFFLYFQHIEFATATLCMGLVIVWRHKKNIKRLWCGEEHRIKRSRD